MHNIKLPIYNTLSLNIDPKNITKAPISEINGIKVALLGRIDVTKQTEDIPIVRDNGAQIIYATVDIENKLESILSTYLFGPVLDVLEQRDFFVNELLQSSHLGFSAKKAIVQKLINKYNLLEGKQKNILESNLKKILDWRNAFAHGNIGNDSRDGCLIKYFSGSPKVQKLDDEFWAEIEKCFVDTDKILKEILEKVHKLYFNEKT